MCVKEHGNDAYFGKLHLRAMQVDIVSSNKFCFQGNVCIWKGNVGCLRSGCLLSTSTKHQGFVWLDLFVYLIVMV